MQCLLVSSGKIITGEFAKSFMKKYGSDMTAK
jgi:hypothetical protein